MRYTYSFVMILILLQVSCKTTTTTTTTTIPTAAKEDPPLYIEYMQPGKTKLYASMPHRIKVHTISGSTGHLKVEVVGSGKVLAIDTAQGIYSIQNALKGTAMEVVATDTASGKKAFVTYLIADAPAPKAYLGVYKGGNRGPIRDIDAYTFRAQNAILLTYDGAMPMRCNATQFEVIRVDGGGKRTTVTNKTGTGKFSDKEQQFTALAKSGDIFIFKSIQTDCSNEYIQDLVYILK